MFHKCGRLTSRSFCGCRKSAEEYFLILFKFHQKLDDAKWHLHYICIYIQVLEKWTLWFIQTLNKSININFVNDYAAEIGNDEMKGTKGERRKVQITKNNNSSGVHLLWKVLFIHSKHSPALTSQFHQGSYKDIGGEIHICDDQHWLLWYTETHREFQQCIFYSVQCVCVWKCGLAQLGSTIVWLARIWTKFNCTHTYTHAHGRFHFKEISFESLC